MLFLKFIVIVIIVTYINYTPLEEKNDKVEQSEEIEFMEYKEEVYNLVNNNGAADSLIKTLYTDGELKSICGYMRLQNNKAECIRKNKDYIYTINKSKEGYYLFNMYNFDENEDWEIDRWYCKKKFTLKNFTNLVKKETSFEDVEKFDAYGEYTGLYVSNTEYPFSIHHTIDGYKVIVYYYPDKENKLAVGEIQILAGEDNPIYYNMLDIDKELLKK